MRFPALMVGRGAMRYLDPESIAARRMPTNYDRRGPDTRPRRPRHHLEEGEKWQRGVEARPTFDRGAPPHKRSGDDLDRYRVKGRSERDEADQDGKERRKRDWDDWRVGRDAAFGQRFEKGREEPTEEKRAGLDYRSRSRSVERDGRGVSPRRSRSRSPVIRPDSPPRGARSDAGSDMVLDADD